MNLGKEFLDSIERYPEKEGDASPGPEYTGNLVVDFYSAEDRIDKVIELDEMEQKHQSGTTRISLERTKYHMKMFRERVKSMNVQHHSGAVFTEVEKFLESAGAARLFVRVGSQLLTGVPLGNG